MEEIKRRVSQTRENEVTFADALAAAFPKVVKALSLVGSVSEENRAQQFIAGTVRYGLQSVKIRISLAEDGSEVTRAVIQAKGDDAFGVAAKSATNRLAEAMLNLDNPGYQPDRGGMSAGVLFGSLCAFGILFFILMRFVFRVF